MNVRVQDARRLALKMIVNGGDVDAAFAQAIGDWAQLLFGEDQVSHHGGASTLGTKGNPTTEREGRQNTNASDIDLQIASRKAKADDAARLGEPGSAERLLDCAPVVGGQLRGRWA